MGSNNSFEPDIDIPPPAEPPPLLTEDQLIGLLTQGWMTISLPESLQEELKALSCEMRGFFDKPNEEKASQYPSKLGTEFGFYHVVNEKEYVTLRCNMHPDSGLEERSKIVWRTIAIILHRILCDIARASELPTTVWDHVLDGTLELPQQEKYMTGTLLRLFRYYPGSGFAAQHTDLGLLTLCIGAGRGLQVLEFNGTNKIWKDVDGPTILVGQTLRALSGNRIRPGSHRVVENLDGRSSIVFALRHSHKHQIDLSQFGGEGLIDPKQLWEEVKFGIVNINATAEVRERQREEIKLKRSQISSSNPH